jgi:EmrB/QacA subfamily drug resistance transporter
MSLLASARQYRVPLIVASALFMENLDSTVITTSLPIIARSFAEDVLRLNLAVTCYLLSLAVFIPLSGWVADRFGARTVFRTAIGVFTIGSILCGVSLSPEMFVAARILQGIGCAMMVPVGRLVILRTVPKTDLVRAMSYLTVPALIGPIVGPALGGLISTYTSWRWIFLINVPIGALGIYLATRFLENVREAGVPKLDVIGAILSGAGLAALVFGFETIDRGTLPGGIVAALLAGGALCIAVYALHARRTENAIIDLRLLRIPTFSLATLGGSLFRIGGGAYQLLLPLMLQLAFGMTPFASGLLQLAGAAGSMPMKMSAPFFLKRFGFRSVLIGTAFINGLFLIVCGLFTEATPALLIFAILLTAGFFRSLQFTSVNTIAYAEVSSPAMSRATSFASMAQQLSSSLGVATGAFLLHEFLGLRGGAELERIDFVYAFTAAGLITFGSAAFFVRLAPNAGAEISGKSVVKRRDVNRVSRS